MKLLNIVLIFFVLSVNCYSQTLIETIEGDEIVFFQNGRNNSNVFGNFNLSDKSIQLNTTYFINNHNFLTLGLRGKPSDGTFNFLSDGSFTPNTTVDLTYSKLNIFSDIKENTTFIDFLNIKAKYNRAEMKLFNFDLPYDSQIIDTIFDGFGVTLNYNIFLKGAHLFSITSGYQNRSNYSKLKSVEVREFSSINNPNLSNTREYGQTLNGKMGNYIEDHTIPIKLAYTYLPSEIKADSNQLKTGITCYYSSILGDFIPNHNTGIVVFLTKQDSTTGIRTSVIGLGIQLNNMFNIYENNTSIVNSLSFNLTSTINLFSL